MASTKLQLQGSGTVLQSLSPTQIKYQMLFDQNCTSPPSKEKRYRDTTVLLLSWVGSDLDVDPEVCFPENTQSGDALTRIVEQIRNLEDVFHREYNFQTQKLQISDKRPQSQLNMELANFVHNHGHDGNLLIIYYAGHGFYNKDEHEFQLFK